MYIYTRLYKKKVTYTYSCILVRYKRNLFHIILYPCIWCSFFFGVSFVEQDPFSTTTLYHQLPPSASTKEGGKWWERCRMWLAICRNQLNVQSVAQVEWKHIIAHLLTTCSLLDNSYTMKRVRSLLVWNNGTQLCRHFVGIWLLLV